MNILKRAKERMLHVTSVNVEWSCSPEFDANQEQGISFLEDDSYTMLAKPVVQTGERYATVAVGSAITSCGSFCIFAMQLELGIPNDRTAWNVAVQQRTRLRGIRNGRRTITVFGWQRIECRRTDIRFEYVGREMA